MATHREDCGRFCPYPDTAWIAPGASLPKCRGGDCTLCDEIDCTCGAEECRWHPWNEDEMGPRPEKCPACQDIEEAYADEAYDRWKDDQLEADWLDIEEPEQD